MNEKVKRIFIIGLPLHVLAKLTVAAGHESRHLDRYKKYGFLHSVQTDSLLHLLQFLGQLSVCALTV